LIKKIDTGKGQSSSLSSINKPNGLASPAAVDVDHDGVIDYIYAGDLQGNMWKFDVTGSAVANWKVAYSGAPLFTTIEKDLQPITTRAEVATGLDGGGLMVYFGTGKYFESAVDSDPAAQTKKQAFYGIWDKGSAVADTTKLVKQTVVEVKSGLATGNYRMVSANAVDPATKLGWYMELPIQGERQVTNSALVNDAIVFTTLIPEQRQCSAGGSSWLMELDRKTGGRLSYTFMDVNGDGVFDANDQLAIEAEGGENGYVGGWQEPSPSGGSSGIYSAPLILPKDGQTQVKIMSSSSGAIVTMTENNGRPTGRLSWRELLID
jgi:type IV pilus assembly protein PilY1